MKTNPLVIILVSFFTYVIIFEVCRFLFVTLPKICRSHNSIFYQPTSTGRPNGFDQQFCEVLYALGKLCGINGSHIYEDSERTLDNDITPINGSFPGSHHIMLKSGVLIAYCIDYYDGTRKIYRKRVTYKNEPIPEATANQLLQREYDFFKSLYDKERAKRDAEIAALAS